MGKEADPKETFWKILKQAYIIDYVMLMMCRQVNS
jgi:hypothetical protein